jgi:hypothetical protein
MTKGIFHNSDDGTQQSSIAGGWTTTAIQTTATKYAASTHGRATSIRPMPMPHTRVAYARDELRYSDKWEGNICANPTLRLALL